MAHHRNHIHTKMTQATTTKRIESSHQTLPATLDAADVSDIPSAPSQAVTVKASVSVSRQSNAHPCLSMLRDGSKGSSNRCSIALYCETWASIRAAFACLARSHHR